MRRGDTLVTKFKLNFFGELLNFFANDGAVRHPQRQTLADKVIEVEEIELFAEFLVVARFCFFALQNIGIEFVF